jgi:hypothetical protein
VLGSLYLYGFGAPKDFSEGANWINAAAGTAALAIGPNVVGQSGLSATQLFAMMLGGAKALPDLVERDGAAWGIALYKHQTKVIIQAMGACLDNPSPQR